MSQDECSTEARMYTRRKPKEGTTRSGATAPTERHCADKAPVRQQGATHKGSKTKSPFCVVLKTYHLDTWILHKTCLKHSNFLNRKTVCQSFPHGTSWQHERQQRIQRDVHGENQNTHEQIKVKIPQNSKLYCISLASFKTSLMLMISLSPLLSACCPVVLLSTNHQISTRS